MVFNATFNNISAISWWQIIFICIVLGIFVLADQALSELLPSLGVYCHLYIVNFSY